VACDKIVRSDIFGFILKEKCCPDCGSKTGIAFFEFEYLLCDTCSSLFYSSSKRKPRTITRHMTRKYKIQSWSIDYSTLEFGVFSKMWRK
jgi:hypothetical protein